MLHITEKNFWIPYLIGTQNISVTNTTDIKNKHVIAQIIKDNHGLRVIKICSARSIHVCASGTCCAKTYPKSFTLI